MTPQSIDERRFVVVTDGDRPVLSRLPERFADATVIVADGGARHARFLGLAIDHVVGDLDSLTTAEVQQLREAGASIEVHPTDKDETDFELALALTRTLAAGRSSDVLVVGGAGGRLDHFASNLAVLAGPITSQMSLTAAMGEALIHVVRPQKPVLLDSSVGSLVTLLAMGGDARGVTTAGLAYPLHDAVLRAGAALGTSNRIVEHPATVELGSGALLTIEPDYHHNPKEA